MNISTKVILVISLHLTFLTTNLFSQAPDTVWTKTFGGLEHDWGSSLIQSNDGGIVITGSTESFGAGERDIYLLKTDSNGNLIWEKTFGGSADDYASEVKQTSDGGFIIVGSTKSYGAGDYDAYLIKTDINGIGIWAKTFGGSGSDGGAAVEQTTDGGYLVAVNKGSIHLVKTNEVGAIIWEKQITSYDSRCMSVKETMDSGFILTGYKQYGPSTNARDVILIKLDSFGEQLWTKTFEGCNQSMTKDEGHFVQIVDQGGYIIAGFSYNICSSPSSEMDFYLIKTDINGDSIWTKLYGGSDQDMSYSVLQTEDKGFIVVGKTSSFGAGSNDAYIIKVDENGNKIWTKILGGTESDWLNSIQQTLDNSFIITGYVSIDAWNRDVWLIKLGSEINYINEIDNFLLETFSLHQNFPNPFNPSTTISYRIPELSFVTLKVYDVLGNELKTLVSEEKQIGSYDVEFDGMEFPSGVYFYKLQAGDYVESKKMVLMK